LGSDLVLHGPADLPCDRDALAAQFHRLDLALGPGGRHFFGSLDGGWTSIPLMSGIGQDGGPEPVLKEVPAVADLLSRIPGRMLRSHFMRQGPGGMLDWHFDTQAIHLEECRLLMPVQAPPEAYTLLGHLAVAYPEGQVWTGDFNFPHKVVNPGDRDRIMLVMDVVPTPALAALLPPGLGADLDLRRGLAEAGRNALAEQRAAGGF
jgi:hypothetical protein